MRVCVIGAGACGLVAAKKLLDQGVEVVVFERNGDLGGNWLYGSPGSSVYRSTHLISSKKMTELRDFPLPDDWPPYISHEQALEYFHRYAEHFHLVCATGFEISFPFLDDGYLNLHDGLPVLYKNLFHPRIENLAFIGLIQPNSGLWFLAELQAELAARALTRPSPRLRAAVADRQDTRYFDYLPSRRHHLEVDYLLYERDLRRLLRLTASRKEAAA